MIHSCSKPFKYKAKMILAVLLVSNFTVTSLVGELESVSHPPYFFFMTNTMESMGTRKKHSDRLRYYKTVV